MVTHPNGQTEKATIESLLPKDKTIPGKWQALLADEYLYHFLLKTTKLKAFDDGLPDEEQKVLKHYGVTYWEPGMEKVLFEGTLYQAMNTNAE